MVRRLLVNQSLTFTRSVICSYQSFTFTRSEIKPLLTYLCIIVRNTYTCEALIFFQVFFFQHHFVSLYRLMSNFFLSETVTFYCPLLIITFSRSVYLIVDQLFLAYRLSQDFCVSRYYDKFVFTVSSPLMPMQLTLLVDALQTRLWLQHFIMVYHSLQIQLLFDIFIQRYIDKYIERYINTYIIQY